MDNYFNYFTEIEECFRRTRGTPTLLSPLDWALIESWKEAGIPLAAVLRGIERAFEKFSKRPKRFRKVNSLAYCSQAVYEAAQELSTARAESGAGARKEGGTTSPFAPEEILAYLNRCREEIERAAHEASVHGQPVLAEDLTGAMQSLRKKAAQASASPQELEANLEDFERELTALEEKLTASMTRASSEELLTEFRREVERGLAASRPNLSATQIESLQRQFLKRRLFEHYKIPRLSLFYL